MSFSRQEWDLIEAMSDAERDSSGKIAPCDQKVLSDAGEVEQSQKSGDFYKRVYLNLEKFCEVMKGERINFRLFSMNFFVQNDYQAGLLWQDLPSLFFHQLQ